MPVSAGALLFVGEFGVDAVMLGGDGAIESCVYEIPGEHAESKLTAVSVDLA